MMKTELITRDSKNNFRYVSLEWDKTESGYVINRQSGLLNGKKIQQPDIIIDRGKASRTVKQQLDLQFNSLIKGFTDKGYKICENPFDKTTEELENLLGITKTDDKGNIKPMLAKAIKDIKSKKVWDKDYYASVKINGLRCTIFWDGKDVRTKSRGGMDYDLAMFHIINHPDLINFFKENPDIILDGEVYNFGKSLAEINSICRSQSTVDESQFIEYYVYDVIFLNKPFTERLEILKDIQKKLNLEWLNTSNPVIAWKINQLQIFMVPHIQVTGKDNIMKLHDDWVEHGWEGAVIRLADSEYIPGARNASWLKVKQYLDDSFLIVGIEQGLRMYDDMVFIMQTKDGKTFKAKPIGSRTTKRLYTENADQYIGHYGDVKYFEISPYGIPEQGIFLQLRPDLDEME